MPGPAPSGRASTKWKMFSDMSCSPLVMNRLTPSMCQVPSGCSIALVRPAPTSEPASARSAPSWPSTGARPPAWRTRCCSACRSARAPWRTRRRWRTSRSPGSRRGSARRRPSTASAARALPPSSGGSSSLNHSASMKARNDLANASGMVHRVRGRVEDRRVPVAVGERLGDRADGEPVDLVEDAAAVSSSRSSCGADPSSCCRSENLEEVELDVTQVALEVGHVRPPAAVLAVGRCARSGYRAVT